MTLCWCALFDAPTAIGCRTPPAYLPSSAGALAPRGLGTGRLLQLPAGTRLRSEDAAHCWRSQAWTSTRARPKRMASAGTKRRAAEAAAGAASGGSSAVGGKRKRGAGPPPPSDGRDDDGWDVDAEAAAAMRAGVEVAAVAAAFGQRDVGSNLLDHYVRRLEGSRGDALAAYETVWVCDQLCEDVAARCAALPPSRRDAAAALLVDLSDAKVAVLDTAYEAVDILISQLDRRARLLEAVVREQCTSCAGVLACLPTAPLPATPRPAPTTPLQRAWWTLPCARFVPSRTRTWRWAAAQQLGSHGRRRWQQQRQWQVARGPAPPPPRPAWSPCGSWRPWRCRGQPAAPRRRQRVPRLAATAT